MHWTNITNHQEMGTNRLVDLFRIIYPFIDTDVSTQRTLEAIARELATRDLQVTRHLGIYLKGFLRKAKTEGDFLSIVLYTQLLQHYQATVLSNH